MLYLGIDVGNFDTKSQNTVIPSGYEGPFTSKPPIAKQYLMYNGNYYIPTTTRFPYLKDKTTNERALFLTLMSIGSELIYKFSKVKSDEQPRTKEEIQYMISSVTEIALGVGLPPNHYTSKFVSKLITYYNNYMQEGISFEYNGFIFNFSLKNCKVYPQGGAGAVCINKITSFPAYFIVDIGGYTVDTIFFENNTPSGKWSSKEKGIITLYDDIIDKVAMEHDMTIDARNIESVLKEEKNILSAEVKETIKSMTQHHADTILNTLKESGIEFKAYPCLFMGGGSLLLKPYIIKNPLISKEGIHFISDNKANAIGYARLLKADLKK